MTSEHKFLLTDLGNVVDSDIGLGLLYRPTMQVTLAGGPVQQNSRVDYIPPSGTKNLTSEVISSFLSILSMTISLFFTGRA
jgi:hypothetical protein